ncbi:type VII toxin-antitoxin system HepT family RNase toxin [Clostridium manihotivorum]|uniref:DUF86 domain-containing protein n=1 Tax=Clostridium manihotivorum TaxID=2320868 RepID=A0A3R5R1R6_9CLOT|nr:DUF86 domain-containing protein [Clostridium manihotivorum]QAA34750.1 DUF86 domain-containing protein [Clostridium manihotivorum]
MVKREIVITRLNKLKEYIDFLNNIKKHSKEEYLGDPFIYGATERFLHLSIECVLDISNHVIADMRFRRPESNREIFQILCDNNIIDRTLSSNLSNMAGFRNILVHDYVRLDREVVYDIIINHLKDIESFMKIISEYI